MINFLKKLKIFLLGDIELVKSLYSSKEQSIGIFKEYLLWVSIIPAVSFGFTKVFYFLSGKAELVAATDLFGVIFSGLIAIALSHFWSVIIDGLMAAKNINQKFSGYLVTSYLATPWFISYAFFPLIQGFALIGLILIVIRIRPALILLCGVPETESFRLSIATIALWLGAFLFSNLVFVGFLALTGM